MKRFLEWIRIKSALDANSHQAPDVFEGEIWWTSLGENIGNEIQGKDRNFTRPVIIYKRLSRTFYFVIPVTTQPHKGTWFVSYDFQGKSVTACIHQARAIDYRRLYSLLGHMDKASFARVQEAFRKLYF
jgi:mRNA-degrading endonuclease toxin of MazEF toxin-antitoxin module